MLRKLIIKNYALIDEIEIDFNSGFSIITGETGAGKSIILGALGLLLGGRSDSRAIADKSRKTIVEAIFKDDKGEETIVRREISPSGKSRAFVDDSPVILQSLSEITLPLLDIHSQHSNLTLNSREGQLEIIDAMSDSEELLEDYRSTFREYVDIRKRLRKIQAENDRLKEREEILKFQFEELKKLNPRPGETEEVERKYELLSDADEIRINLGAAFQSLNGNDSSALQLIRASENELRKVNLKAFETGIPEEETLISRLKSIYIELKDISDSIESYMNSVESNPQLLAATGARMRQLLEAANKYKVENSDGLVELKENIYQELARIEEESEIVPLENKARDLARILKEKSEKLTSLRVKGAEKFARKLEERTIPLGLPNLKFEVRIESGKLTSDGKDVIYFLCSFNKNGELLPISSTASGGELSRLTLGIKSLMADKMKMPTVIFDEIDTGVSGEVADKMGKMMKEMAEKMQVITITHLPQVASLGANHYKVFKRDTEERTISDIRLLGRDERVKEIAGMLSGERVTESGLRAAEELLRDS